MIEKIVICITIFIIFSFIGFIVEQINDRGKEHYSHIIGNIPFLPIYGIGAVFAFLLSLYIESPYLQLLIITMIIVPFEYISGILCNNIYKKECWDYKNSLKYIDIPHTIVFVGSTFILTRFFVLLNL